ncbi:MAG: type II toxin-antitoxin system RelE/ParE family toxin [Bacteroidales bacterium]|nr:type II toxin-antitoxin system RelE/ParE family toxin [Bacteroidales bacterium]
MEDNQNIKFQRLFQTILSEEVVEFLKKQDVKARQKILYNIRKAEMVADPELFKKLTGEIWEFRTLWKNLHYRLLAFWDNEDGRVVITTHCFIKKTAKIPLKELEKAMEMRNEYIRIKNISKHEII